MTNSSPADTTPAPPPRRRFDLGSILRLTELADLVIPFAIRVACELGVADHLRDGPHSVEDLAVAVGADPGALLRLLRALAAKEIFTEVKPRRFALTPLAEPLRSDHPLSMREAYPLIAADVQAWARFDHSVRTGRSAFDQVHGEGYWQYMASRPDASERFDGTQLAATRLELRTVLPAYDRWADLRTVVDVGGGNGAFLAGLLSRFPHMRGTLLDLPYVVAGAAKLLAEAGVLDRCEAIGGSFFEHVPAGADAYLLKRVLYHWSDDEATTLLRTIRKAMRPDSRLLLLEPVAEAGDELNAGKLYDLILLTMAGGGLRTREQIERLLPAADLRIARVISTVMFPLVEALPR